MQGLDWAGQDLGAGPLLLELQEPVTDGETSGGALLVSAKGGNRFRVPICCLARFLHAHEGSLFLGTEVAKLHWALCGYLSGEGEGVARRLLWDLSASGRWVDVQLLDRQVRFGRLQRNLALRPLCRIAAEWGEPQTADRPADGQRTEAVPESGGVPFPWDAIERLFQEAERQLEEADQPRRPPDEPPDISAYRQSPQGKEHARRLAALFARRRARSLPAAEVDPSREAAQPPSSSPAQGQGRTPGGYGSLGRVEVCAAIATAPQRKKPCASWGLLVDVPALKGLVEKAEDRYTRASEELARAAQLAGIVRLDGQGRVPRNERGYPVWDKKMLAKWLRHKAKALVGEAWHEVVPQENGDPDANLERWGVWSACDRELWAAREVGRMAELMRMRDEEVEPCYTTLPALRSVNPDFAQYRKLGVPVFKPRPGNVFLAGRLPLLRLRSLAATALGRGYCGSSRLVNHFLARPPAEVVAGSLAGPDPGTAEAAPVAAVDPADAEPPDFEIVDSAQYLLAEAFFVAVRTSETPEWGRDRLTDEARIAFYTYAQAFSGKLTQRLTSRQVGWLAGRYTAWVGLTCALLDALVFGLSDSQLVSLVRNEYRVDEEAIGRVTETSVKRWRTLLMEEVVYELKPFLRDTTHELISARLGESGSELDQRRAPAAHPETYPRARANTVRQRRIALPEGTTGRRELLTLREVSLCGRVTPPVDLATARQQAVLLGADEVMISIAYALASVGLGVSALTANEFVVEVPTTVEERAKSAVSELAVEAAREVLGGMWVELELTCTDAW